MLMKGWERRKALCCISFKTFIHPVYREVKGGRLTGLIFPKRTENMSLGNINHSINGNTKVRKSFLPSFSLLFYSYMVYMI